MGTDSDDAPADAIDDATIAAQLVASYAADAPLSIAPGHELPSPREVEAAVVDLRELLFPGFTGGVRGSHGVSLKAHVEARLAQVRVRVNEQVYRGLHHRCRAAGADCGPCQSAAERITDGLLMSLPALRTLLMTDVRAAFEGDPAATGADEVVFSYPGIAAICVYRIAHRLYQLGAAIVPRMMTELAHSETGIDIHPAATIGEGFFIDHGTGVVIGETTVIGNRVRIYQGVTLGALSLPTSKVRALASAKRHPTIEDDVIIYANATILGGDTVIGRGAVVGGNSWITESVAGRQRSTTG
ncbi:MAG: Serine O-acetyltransferase [Myxococcales bacterium]|nr:Serine O-acetyltransferase [Myxococcales bacterium]